MYVYVRVRVNERNSKRVGVIADYLSKFQYNERQQQPANQSGCEPPRIDCICGAHKQEDTCITVHACIVLLVAHDCTNRTNTFSTSHPHAHIFAHLQSTPTASQLSLVRLVSWRVCQQQAALIRFAIPFFVQKTLAGAAVEAKINQNIYIKAKIITMWKRTVIPRVLLLLSAITAYIKFLLLSLLILMQRQNISQAVIVVIYCCYYCYCCCSCCRQGFHLLSWLCWRHAPTSSLPACLPACLPALPTGWLVDSLMATACPSAPASSHATATKKEKNSKKHCEISFKTAANNNEWFLPHFPLLSVLCFPQ